MHCFAIFVSSALVAFSFAAPMPQAATAAGGAGGLAGGAIDTAGSLLDGQVHPLPPSIRAVGTVGNALDGVAGVAGNLVDGVGGVATGAVGAVGDVANGAVGAVGDVANGAVGAVGGVANGCLKDGACAVHADGGYTETGRVERSNALLRVAAAAKNSSSYQPSNA
ncbi:hypothetical protein PG985_002561 [Apiospora marii]|uniref:uncharacterized protein n=1 Tax=Apiospora marii TaxID=335849 RepID=UPI0031305006